MLTITFVYTLISLGLLYATWRQARLANESLARTRKAAQAAPESADAAKASVDIQTKALFDLKRPWVFPGIRDPRGWNRFWPANAEQMAVGLEWYIQNCGRTPAFLIDGTYRMAVFRVPIPDTPDYGMDRDIALVPLAQNVPQVYHAQLTLTRQEHQDLVANKSKLVVYGFLKYRDTFGTDHLSRWIMVFVTPRFVPSGQLDNWWIFQGPSAYTEYT